MFKNYFKIALRNFFRYKTLSFINIFGLAVGITCCVLAGLFIRDELSYDKYNKDSGNIYRVVKDFVNDDGTKIPDATTPPAIAVALQKEVPEIEATTRIFPGWGRKYYIKYGEKRFLEENIYRVDSSFFQVFTVDFVGGNRATAFKDLKSVIITETTAKKYFGKEEAIGKIFEFDEMGSYMVTGVIKDNPRNSHFKYDFLISLKTLGGDPDQSWGWYNFYTYIKLKDHGAIASVENKIRAIFKKNQPENKNIFYTQPLTSIHLSSNLKWELQPNSDKAYIYIFGTIALFLLLIACINYVNLTTARSSLRAKEIGIRKVSGAVKAALIRQFLAEAVLLALFAVAVALIMAQLILPALNHITGKQLSMVPDGNYVVLMLLVAFGILVGLIAGLYPAIYLSSFRPAKVLKGEKLSGFGKFSLRKVLVVTQFSISIFLIIGIIIVIQQVKFIQNAKLGLNKDNVVILNDIAYLNRSGRSALKNELIQVAGVKKVAAADGVIGGQNWTNAIRYKGSQNGQLVNFLNVDADFLETMSIELKEGRNFSPEHPSDTADAIILNETALKQLGVPAPATGQQIVWSEDRATGKISYATIIGVVKDFHFTSMKNEIKPFAFVTDNSRQFNFTVKVNGAGMNQAIAGLKEVWDKNVRSRPFQYSFLDETYARLYASEVNFKTIFLFITIIAIFIACLGLMGLSSFITEQRTKEIGIRKVLGASAMGIVKMLSGDFVKLVLIAALLAFPVAWWATNKWLQDFVYRISIGWWVFIVAAGIALLIALITVSAQAIKAAIANPVKSLRTE